MDAEESEVRHRAAAKLEKQYRKRGVIYLSRIPPFMGPNLLRKILSQYGEIGRIHLTPEGWSLQIIYIVSSIHKLFSDASSARLRRKFKNSTRKNYIDGWIEFEKKKIAKQVALALNNTNIGRNIEHLFARLVVSSYRCVQVEKSAIAIMMTFGTCDILPASSGIISRTKWVGSKFLAKRFI